ncbi:hypothetical protein HDU85_004828 [Gaertneriomyces sp. JEL0708]|nr:hypothetical protein HDU85_004828 [Gaertneriomyces sp. JEL0708]
MAHHITIPNTSNDHHYIPYGAAPAAYPRLHPQQTQPLPPLSTVTGLPTPLARHQARVPSYPKVKEEPAASPPPTITSLKKDREFLRKVSHSAIERRRRERINDKISTLRKLVPQCHGQENLHKLSILQNAIDYIRLLQKELDETRTVKNPSNDGPVAPGSPPSSAASDSWKSERHTRSPVVHSSDEKEEAASPPHAPSPYRPSRRPSLCELPRPARTSSPTPPTQAFNSDHEYDVAGGLLLLAQQGTPSSISPLTPEKRSNVMALGNLLC